MKKTSFILFALLAVSLLTACGDSDDDQTRQTFTIGSSNRVVSGDNVYFSQGSGKIELNYTDMTIQFVGDYKKADEQTHQISTAAMKMTLVGNNAAIYQFSQPTMNLEGYIDLSTFMIWYKFDDGDATVYSTGIYSFANSLLYAYATTTATNPDNDNVNTHEKSAYVFVLDSKAENCSMMIYNFIPNIAGIIEAGQIKYNGLSVTPTATGYDITASQAESSSTGYYPITDLVIKLDNQCRIIDGSFKCNDLNFTITGYLFPTGQAY